MAQLQMDAAGLKGFTVNSTICHGRTSDIQDDVGVRSITEINYRRVNDFKALTSRSVFEQGSSISYHPKRETCKDISGLVSLKTWVCGSVEGIGMDKGSTLN